LRICIYGAGAVGGNFAARLAKAGVDVSLIARGAHLQAIQARGLTVLAGEERIHVRPFATDDPKRAGVQDAVIVTLKAHSIPGAVDAMQPLLGPDTSVVFGINGVPWWYFHKHPGPLAERRLDRLDPGGVLWDRLPIERAIGSVVYSPNEITSPGVVTNGGRNRLVLGEPDGSISERAKSIGAVLTSAGIDGPVIPDIRAELWRKLIGNLAWNPITAITGLTTRDLVGDPPLRALVKSVLEEGIAVAAKLGVTIEGDAESRLKSVETGPRTGPAHRTSMFQDFDLKRPPELDAIVLAVQDFAREVGVATPAIDAVAAFAVGRARALGIYGQAA
jgi:2-dehydropantoate 2-reductase